MKRRSRDNLLNVEAVNSRKVKIEDIITKEIEEEAEEEVSSATKMEKEDKARVNEEKVMVREGKVRDKPMAAEEGTQRSILMCIEGQRKDLDSRGQRISNLKHSSLQVTISPS